MLFIVGINHNSNSLLEKTNREGGIASRDGFLDGDK